MVWLDEMTVRRDLDGTFTDYVTLNNSTAVEEITIEIAVPDDQT